MSAANCEPLGVHCRLIKLKKNAWGKSFSLFLTVTVGSNEVRHSLFPLGFRCIPVRSAQTISAHPRKYTLCVWAMWEPSFLFWTADREEVGAPGFKPQQAWLWLDPHYYLMAETSNRGGKELHTTFSHKYTLKAAFNVGKHNFLVNHMTAHCTDCVTKQQGWGFFFSFFESDLHAYSNTRLAQNSCASNCFIRPKPRPRQPYKKSLGYQHTLPPDGTKALNIQVLILFMDQWVKWLYVMLKGSLIKTTPQRIITRHWCWAFKCLLANIFVFSGLHLCSFQPCFHPQQATVFSRKTEKKNLTKPLYTKQQTDKVRQ